MFVDYIRQDAPELSVLYTALMCSPVHGLVLGYTGTNAARQNFLHAMQMCRILCMIRFASAPWFHCH